MRLLNGDALYERTAELEAQALRMCAKTMYDEDHTEWRKWSAILSERSAFKYDVVDAPTVDAIPVEWLEDLHKTAQSEEADRMIDEIIALWEARKNE